MWSQIKSLEMEEKRHWFFTKTYGVSEEEKCHEVKNVGNFLNLQVKILV